MATVAQQSELVARIDYALDYLLSEWSVIPEVSAEWDEWEEYSRLDFVLEWPLREDQFHELQSWHADGLLAPMQLERFRDLEMIIDRNRPMLDRLLED